MVIKFASIFVGFSRFFRYLGSIKLGWKSMQNICVLR